MRGVRPPRQDEAGGKVNSPPRIHPQGLGYSTQAGQNGSKQLSKKPYPGGGGPPPELRHGPSTCPSPRCRNRASQLCSRNSPAATWLWGKGQRHRCHEGGGATRKELDCTTKQTIPAIRNPAQKSSLFGETGPDRINFPPPFQSGFRFCSLTPELWCASLTGFPPAFVQRESKIYLLQMRAHSVHFKHTPHYNGIPKRNQQISGR